MIYFLIISVFIATAQASDFDDLGPICRKTGTYIFEVASNKNTATFEKLTFNQKTVELNIYDRSTTYNTFIYLNSPSVNIAEFLYFINILHMGFDQRDIKKFNFDRDKFELLAAAKKWFQVEHKKQSPNLMVDSLFKIYTNPSSVDAFDEIMKAYYQECNKIGLFKCDNRFYKLVRVVGLKNKNVPMSPEMVRFLMERKYYDKILDSTLYLIDKVVAVQKGEKVTGDIFSNLVNLLIEKGSSPKEANNFVWHFLGMYGTRGASFTAHGGYGSPFHLNALQVLALSISYLDKVKFKQSGSSYALPAQYKTDCVYGKPYHFWMSAYIARYGLSFGQSKVSAFSAAFALGMGYDVWDVSNERNPDVVFGRNLYSTALNSKRIDNGWRLLGAFYALNKDTLKNRRVDPLILSTFKKAKLAKIKTPSSDPKKKVLQRIHAWVNVVRPEILIRSLWKLKI